MVRAVPFVLLVLLAFATGNAPAAEADSQQGRDAAALLARPLFNPGRRPAVIPLAPNPPTPPLPRLSGTVLTPAGRFALFVADDLLAIRTEGQRVGPYGVTLIEPGQVTLASPWGVVVLHPAAPAGGGSRVDAPSVQALLDAVQDMR